MITLREKNSVEIKGIFEMRLYRHGRVIESVYDDNLIVNGARFQMAHLIAGEFPGRNITRIAFGTSGTEPIPENTSIANQYARAIQGFSYPTAGQVQFDWYLPTAENNGMAILEFGLLTADNTLFSRKTRTNPIHKEPDISIEGHWTIIF